MTKNITPLYKIIPISLSVFLEDDGLGTRVGGVGSLGGKLATEVNDASVKQRTQSIAITILLLM